MALYEEYEGENLMKKEMVGIVLAGGQSRRFGSPKAFAERNGIPFYFYSIQAMDELVESIVLVTNESLFKQFRNEKLSVELTTDHQDFAGLGPLAGIYTAMEKVEAEWYLIAPVDVPFIEKRIFSLLLPYRSNNPDVIVPIAGDRLQPLLSIFRGTMKDKIKEQLLGKELSIKQLFDKCTVSYVEMKDDLLFTNINSLEEYNCYLE
ncbi:MAG TPA: molybdenum cofactor guanylyltransferase [Ornithinibacillus sp.]|nr:molybdenum cofactor guanylyltransferase [Ornithinibacillus sp.]